MVSISPENINEITFKIVVLKLYFSVIRISRELGEICRFWCPDLWQAGPGNLYFYQNLQPCSVAYGPQNIY